MKKIILAAAAVLALSPAVRAAEVGPELMQVPWSFDGAFGKFDRLQLQRGLQVYREVCASCHSLNYVAFRNLSDLGYSEGQIKAIANEYEYPEIDDEGSDTTRKGKPSDYFPNPYPNEKFARASNNGALPPDLSLVTKSRHRDGPNYIYSLLLGYEDPPAGMEVLEGMSYNKFFSSGSFQIAMVKQIEPDKVTYADGTAATQEQIAQDITAFLHWAAEPKLEARHGAGLRVMLYTLIFTVLAYLLKKRIWARLDQK
ncbi:MAG: cytochrome c1 [Alphaproteobacteria bacterium]|nr:cytochrome c1 [Alphaproteobacteria bacterium]